MKQFSPKSSSSAICVSAALIQAFLFAATPARCAAVKNAPVSAALSKTAQPELTLLFTERAGHHSVLGRSDAQGACKAFLGALGRGWIPYADPSLKGDDLAAVSAPDGARFALLSTRGGSVNLWLLSADGRQAQAVTDDDLGIADAGASYKDAMAFSPDSTRLAYIARGDLWVVDVKNLQARTLIQGGGARSLCWSPAGDALAVTIDGSIHRLAANGGADQVMVAKGCEGPDLIWNSDDSLEFLERGLRKVDSTQNVTTVLASPTEPNSLAALPMGVALLSPVRPGGPSEVVISGAPAGRGAGPAFTQVTQGGAQEVWAAPDGQSLIFMRGQIPWRCALDGSGAKPLSAAPVRHLSLGRLLPLPWACR